MLMEEMDISVIQKSSLLFGYNHTDNSLVNRAQTQKMTSSAFMPSLDPNNLYTTASPLPSLGPQFESIAIVEPKCKSLLLLDDKEELLFENEQKFMEALKIDSTHKIKVVSIFGNTGEGKSHTLNHMYFNGEEVFPMSPLQSSCTLGVRAMYNPELKVLCLDTEGLLGVSKNEHQRTRLLLKILAVSDVIIYRTRAERLTRDMYTFLGGASKACQEHFNAALQKLLMKQGVDKPVHTLCPAVIIFHEPFHTQILEPTNQTPEEFLREQFARLGQSCSGFSSIKYIGLKNKQKDTSFTEVKAAVQKELNSTEVRSARDPKYIYFVIKSLNEKYKCQITDTPPQHYLPAFFTCQEKCQSCGRGCSLSMGHKKEGEPHHNDENCKMQHQFQNFAYFCRKCSVEGRTQRVEPSYQAAKEQYWSSILSSVWSGYIIECPTCGIIYQSREYWYGNKDPKDEAVKVENVHVWPGDKSWFGTGNSAQKVLDGVTSISNVVASVGSQPMKKLGDWVTDTIAPTYWRPNHEIVKCFKCEEPFVSNASKHHCRACGEGFCEGCSSKSQPVPSRGWYEDVRVCDDCYREQPPSFSQVAPSNEVTARRIGETLINSVSMVKSVFDIPTDFIKDTARPSYWTPDIECVNCLVCNKPFGPLLPLHHCRDCGKGVCDNCSPDRKPVPLRGWDAPVRICNNCRS